MLVWQGNLQVQWPGHDPVALKIQFWCANFRHALENMNLEFVGFVHPNLTPLESIRGPALSVYSEDFQTITYFSEIAASQLGLLVSTSTPNAQFDHFVFYSTDNDPKVYARPLILSPPAPLESGQVENSDLPHAHAQVETEKQPIKDSKVSPKVLKQVVLGALRMRGYKPENKDHEAIFKYCYKTTELVLMRQGGGDVEMVKERVEAYLNLFD